MLHIYVFTSTRKADKCPTITVIANSCKIATKLVVRKFTDWNYRGKPQQIII